MFVILKNFLQIFLTARKQKTTTHFVLILHTVLGKKKQCAAVKTCHGVIIVPAQLPFKKQTI